MVHILDENKIKENYEKFRKLINQTFEGDRLEKLNKMYDELEDIKSNAKFAEQLEDDCNNLMAEVTKKDKEFWKENQRSDYFL